MPTIVLSIILQADAGFNCPPTAGEYPDPEDCHKFYKCDESQRAFSFTCDDPLIWNPSITSCDHPKPDATCYAPTTTGASPLKKMGIYFAVGGVIVVFFIAVCIGIAVCYSHKKKLMRLNGAGAGLAGAGHCVQVVPPTKKKLIFQKTHERRSNSPLPYRPPSPHDRPSPGPHDRPSPSPPDRRPSTPSLHSPQPQPKAQPQAAQRWLPTPSRDWDRDRPQAHVPQDKERRPCVWWATLPKNELASSRRSGEHASPQPNFSFGEDERVAKGKCHGGEDGWAASSLVMVQSVDTRISPESPNPLARSFASEERSISPRPRPSRHSAKEPRRRASAKAKRAGGTSSPRRSMKERRAKSSSPDRQGMRTARSKPRRQVLAPLPPPPPPPQRDSDVTRNSLRRKLSSGFLQEYAKVMFKAGDSIHELERR